MSNTNVAIYDFLKKIQTEDISDPNVKNQLQFLIEGTILDNSQGNALGGDAQAIANLPLFRRTWIKNGSGVDVTITFNGLNYVFENGKIYCCDFGEAGFFTSGARKQGHAFESSTEADWISAGGVQKVFYW